MSTPPNDSNEPGSRTDERREIRWDAAAIIAALIGLLSLLVAGYTAYVQRYTANVQREQVRAQVWPRLEIGNDDTDQSITVYNKGVGPAIVCNAQVFVDGKPQPDWTHVLTALGLPAHGYAQSDLNHNVLSAGERVPIIHILDRDAYQHFRAAAVEHLALVNVFYCSTLGECWMYSDHHAVGYKSLAQLVTPIDRCPKLPDAAVFRN